MRHSSRMHLEWLHLLVLLSMVALTAPTVMATVAPEIPTAPALSLIASSARPAGQPQLGACNSDHHPAHSGEQIATRPIPGRAIASPNSMRRALRTGGERQTFVCMSAEHARALAADAPARMQARGRQADFNTRILRSCQFWQP